MGFDVSYLVYAGLLLVLIGACIIPLRTRRRVQEETQKSLFALRSIFMRTYPQENILYCSTSDMTTREGDAETKPEKGYLLLSDMGVYFFVVDAEKNKLMEEVAQTWSTIRRSNCLNNSFQADMGSYSCNFKLDKGQTEEVAAVISGLPSTGI